HSCRTVQRRCTTRKRRIQSREHIAAEQSGLHLLIGGQSGQIDRSICICCERNSASDHSTVIAPVETNPRPRFANLILAMCSLIDPLIMVDSETTGGSRWCSAGAADLRKEESCGNTREDHQRGKSVQIWHADPPRESGDFRSIPCDREKDWRVSQ